MNPATAAVSIGLAAAGLSWLARAAWGVPSAVGAGRGAIRPYAAASSHYRDRKFHNTRSSSPVAAGEQASIGAAMLTRGRSGRPERAVPLATPLAPAEAGDLAVTWFGHSSVVVEIDGHRVLTDPVWSRRVSPSRVLGPARLHPVPVAAEALPQVDAIVISHDHYDHLDRDTVATLLTSQSAPFLVPLGVGAHLRRWKVPEDRIVELDWNDDVRIGSLTVTCLEARHFSGRSLVRDTTQWASWSVVGPEHRAFFGGDTGYTEAFADIGARLGPFDVTLLPVGAYDDRWPDIHMNPEEAARSHGDLQQGTPSSGIVVPVHWATFNLAFHPWSEPVERLLTAAAAERISVVVPMPGQRVDLARPLPHRRWWSGAVS
ncbi:MBL fold metallo-hydrolase [Rhodococcus sp. MEB041]|uniref:MBL fold metallo-hydrolase n=1 Tax=Rhodococcus sp. MEB041 TaxID=3040323 RepID=UPI00254EFF56|nr:MBL fold metallo-hydrolase [Rhodococcus sp. MEB041]